MQPLGLTHHVPRLRSHAEIESCTLCWRWRLSPLQEDNRGTAWEEHGATPRWLEAASASVRRTHEHVRHNAVILGQGNWPRECFAGVLQGYGCTALTQTCCNSYGSMKRAKLSCKNTQPRTL